MNRTTRTIVVMTVATIMATLASVGVYLAIKRIPVREVEVAHSFVAVAARSLPNGSRITEKDVKLAAWPSSNPVHGAFSDIKAVVNRGLISSVLENEPLTESKLAPLESGAGLPVDQAAAVLRPQRSHPDGQDGVGNDRAGSLATGQRLAGGNADVGERENARVHDEGVLPRPHVTDLVKAEEVA